MQRTLPLIVVLILCFACGDDDSGPDTSPGDTGSDTAADTAEDTSVSDTSPPDTNPGDTASADTTPADTGSADTTPADTGSADTTPADTGSADTTPADTGDGLAGLGESCRDNACRSGLICEGGPTCDDRWVCIASLRPCTDDEAPNCNCAGETFYGSSSCPEQSVAYSGECRSEAVSCDRRDIRCRVLEPTCPEGQVASVVGTCWGACVAVDSCVCEEPEDCPDADRYTCHRFRSRCGPYL